MRPLVQTSWLVFLLSLGAGTGSSCVADNCEETAVPPFSVSFTAGGSMEVEGGLATTPAVRLTFVKFHCSGTLSDPLTYNFTVNSGGTMIRAGSGTWSIDVKNEEDRLLVNRLEVDDVGLTLDHSIPFTTLKHCAETLHGNVHVTISLHCSADLSDCALTDISQACT